MRRLFWVGLMAAAASAAPVGAEEAPKAPAPLLSWNPGGFSLQIPVLLNARLSEVSGYPVDGKGGTQPAGLALSPLARIAVRFDSAQVWPALNLHLEYEHDLLTGDADFRKSPPAGLGMPNSAPLTTQPRQAFARAIIAKAVIVEAGLMTSHWGLGLVANDGTHGWTPGSAEFTDPHGGDRVLRALVSSVPLTSLGLMAAVAFDRVWDDDALLTTAELPKGSGLGNDTAYQALVALTLGHDKPWNAGIYGVGRFQTTTDGRQLNVAVIDATGGTRLKFGEKTNLLLAAEGAWIGGATDLAAPVGLKSMPAVNQFGAVGRANLDFGGVGGVLDILYASGDQNLYDGGQNGFNVNSNYDMGLFLFKNVVAGQTGRTVNKASDPSLVGKLPTGLERLPTRGSITNTLAFFPRAWGRPVAGLEIYGGPLIALAAVPPVDPYNSLFVGGDARNALNGVPGTYLGTELDVGVRYRAVLAGTTLTLGLEGGALLPGSALNTDKGNPMGSVYGGRLMIDYRL
jgi:hypothetical protein